MHVPPKLKPGVKLAALLIGMLVDGVMLFICFTTQALDDPSRVAFGALGIMLILLIPIAYEERALKLWLAMVALATYFDTSYLLLSTDATKRVVLTVATDADYKGLADEAERAKNAFTTAQNNYSTGLADKNITRATMQDLNAQLTSATDYARKTEADRKSRFEALNAGNIKKLEITPDDLFLAIPNAVTRGRIMQLLAYGLIAVVIQAMIVFALREGTVKRSRLRDLILGKQQVVKSVPVEKPKRKRQTRKPQPKPEPTEEPREITLDDYRAEAEQSDGSALLPEVVAEKLGISRTEANRMHQELFSGFVFRNDRYVKP